MLTDEELQSLLTEPPPLTDIQRLEREATWLLEALEHIWEHCPEALDEFNGGWIATECVMWRVRERLRTGVWDDAAYEVQP